MEYTPKHDAAWRQRVACQMLDVYKPEKLRADEFDSAFNNVVTAGQELAKGFDSLKRGHLFVARGLAVGARIINRAKTEIANANSFATYAASALHNLVGRLSKLAARKKPPALKDLILDLEALERDFPIVRYSNSVLSVTTEDIVLEWDGLSFDFKAFEINLDMHAVAAGAQKPYEIHAIDPQMAPDGHHCHPHLTGSDLCSGDGTQAARCATADGRLYDFFIVINQILNTYNPDSPYVKLEVWVNGYDEDDENHFVCEICNERYHVDDRYVCYNCNVSVCDNCSSYCDNAGESFCRTCTDDEECAEDCDHYGAMGCLCHENEPCIACREIPSDRNQEQCDHMYRASHYAENGRVYEANMCTNCTEEHADERRPCVLTHSERTDGGTRRNVETRCPHFGEEDCLFVLNGNIEEGTEPAPTEEEAAAAAAEQEVADASEG
jgi:hypothetical protein